MTFLRRHLQEVGICCHSLHGCHLIAPPTKIGSARKSFYLNFCLSQPPVKCVEVEASGVNVRSFGSLPDGEVLVIIQHHDQLVLLPLPAAQLKIQLVAKLSLKDGWLEGGADREGEVLKGTRVCQEFRLVQTKGDEGRGGYLVVLVNDVRWVGSLIPFCACVLKHDCLTRRCYYIFKCIYFDIPERSRFSEVR